MLGEDGMADEVPQPAELDEAGRFAPPLTPAKDVITRLRANIITDTRTAIRLGDGEGGNKFDGRLASYYWLFLHPIGSFVTFSFH